MGEHKCPRCGNTDERLFARRGDILYCRKCLLFSGRDADKKYSTANNISLEIDYSLSDKQKECSFEVLDNLKKGKDVLIHAVTGAGKTELVFASMEYFLKKGLHVGFATPRRDVVIDLLPRIKEAFPKAKVSAVFGGHTDILEGDIVLLTSHQLYRFEKYFDLLIMDEIDAFPYKGDRTLEHFFHRSIRGRYVLMSATPSTADITHIKKEGGEVVELFERYHRGYLPVPECVICHSGFLMFRCLKILKVLLEEDKKVFVFVPTINIGKRLYNFLSVFLDSGSFVSSKEEKRKIDIEKFKRGEYKFLVTTSILERGVTVRNLQVIVYQADDRIFDSASLVQISGRAGRKKDCREGKVYFLSDVMTKEMEKAVDEIRGYNKKAFVPDLS